MSYSGSAIGGGASVGDAISQTLSDAVGVTVTPDYANGTYTVHDGSTSLAFQLPASSAAPDPNTRLVTLTDAADDKLLDVLRDVATDLRGGTPASAEALRGTDLERLSANIDELTRVRAVVGKDAHFYNGLRRLSFRAAERASDLQVGTIFYRRR